MNPLYQLISFEDVTVEVLFDARMYIESGTASLAALRRTEDDVHRLEKILFNLKEAITAERGNDIIYWDVSLHKEIAKCAGNTILQACQELVDKINQTMVVKLSKSLIMLEDCYEEHYKIYEAIKRQDAAAAAQVMQEHSVNSKLLLMD